MATVMHLAKLDDDGDHIGICQPRAQQQRLAVLAAFVLPPRSYARQPLARFAHLQANTQVFTHTHTPKA